MIKRYSLSVIIPVYNAAPYIVRCMDSLRAQTLSGIEVLLVDDHGADDSIRLVQQFIREHQLEEDWHVLATPSNSGPGLARNVGLDAAVGEFVAFCDADDWVDPTMYELLYDKAWTTHAEVVSCDAYMHIGETVKVLSNPSYRDRAYYLSHYVAYLWTYLFSRSFLQQESLRFLPIRSSEDSCFIGEAILTTNLVARVTQPLYHYVVYPDSISHRRHVWRGGEKTAAFEALNDFAKTSGVWSQYRWYLRWVYFKKALLTSAVDYIKSFV